MSSWWAIAVVLMAGVAGVAAILLHRSRTGDLAHPQYERGRSLGSPRTRRPRTVALRAVRALHGALSLAGLGGFLLALGNRSHRGLGEVMVGAAAVVDLPVAIWMKRLKNAEDR